MTQDFKPIKKSTVVHQGPTTQLPPAGDAQREEMKLRTDQLAEAADTVQAKQETHRVDPNAFTLEREILAHQSELYVSNKQEGYHYEWVTFDSPANNKGYMVKLKLGERIGSELVGWEVVRDPMLESVELKAVDGTRKLGDCILMRLREDRFDKLEKHRSYMRQVKEQGITSNLKALGEKHRNKGVIVHADLNEMDPRFRKTIENPSPQAVAAMRGHQAATDRFDKSLRTGEMDLS